MSQNDSQVSDEIDGFRYRVRMMDPMDAGDVLTDLGFIMAPVLGSLGGVFIKERGDLLDRVMDSSDETEGVEIGDSLERALIGFFDRFTKAKQRELMSLMAKHTCVIEPSGDEPELSKMFRMHFRGRVKAMYRWFFFAIKAQFEDFFSGSDDAMSRAIAGLAGKAAADQS